VTLMSSGPRSDSIVQSAVAISGKPMKTPVRNFRDRIHTSPDESSIDETGWTGARCD